MQVLVLVIEDGSAKQKSESEIDQDDLKNVDESIIDIFKMEGQKFFRASVDQREDELEIVWQPVQS